MQDLIVQFYFPRLYRSKDSGRAMLDALLDLVPEFAPEFYNSFEPVNRNFVTDGIDTALTYWGSIFLWKRRKPQVRAAVGIGSTHPRRPFHSSISIHAKPEQIESQKLVNFVEEFSRRFQPDIALVEVRSKEEMDSKRTFQMSSFIMRESLPNLYWLTVFGAPYINLFGRGRLLNTPAANVRELDAQLISIQLTHALMDARRGFEIVECARKTAKQHLDSNAFLDKTVGPGHIYSTPTFNFLD